MKKKVMNGSVVPILEKPNHDSISEKCGDLVNVFYRGDKLSPLELDIERMYIAEKLEKHQNYQKRKSFRSYFNTARNQLQDEQSTGHHE